MLRVNLAAYNKVQGKESVLLFSSDLVASLVPDNRRLRAFDKISLEPGERKTVTFTLSAKDLAFVNTKGQWIIEKGDFVLQVGTETVKIHNGQAKAF